MIEPTAPLTELKLAKANRRYERARTAISVLILVIVTASGAYLIGIARSNKTSLSILRCAVSVEVQRSGAPGSAAQRTAFDACVKRGGPK